LLYRLALDAGADLIRALLKLFEFLAPAGVDSVVLGAYCWDVGMEEKQMSAGLASICMLAMYCKLLVFKNGVGQLTAAKILGV
jgi:hypothetical protein